MELKEKIVVTFLCMVILAFIVYAVENKVYVDTNFNLHNLYNISNLTVLGTCTGCGGAAAGNVTFGFLDTYYFNKTQSIAFMSGNISNLSLLLTQYIDARINSTINITDNSSLIRCANSSNVTCVNGVLSINISVVSKSYVDSQDVAVNNSPRNWTLNENYPSACPANTYVSAINDTTTCSGVADIYALNTGDNLTGNYDFTGNISQNTGYGLCFGPACNASIFYNGTALIIKVS